MENTVSNLEDYREYYLREFELFDGEEFIKFDIVDVNFDQETITLAVTNRGKISVITYDLKENYNGYYFEYEHLCQISIWNNLKRWMNETYVI